MTKSSEHFPKKRLQASTVARLKVVRLSEMGAFLDAGTQNTNDDILLHKLQQTHPVQVGDEIDVFLYKDPKGRLTASMRVPKLREGQIARMRVINFSSDGAFLDAGAERGIFMPFSEMYGRPQVGELIWAKLYTDKSGRLAVTMKVEDSMRRASKSAQGLLKKGDFVTGWLYNITEQGAFIFTTERFIAHLPKEEVTNKLRLGMELKARVTFIRPDGRINVSLRPVKEKALEEDAQMLLAELQKGNGRLPYSDDTPPGKVKARFNISKGAFKRAIGHLLKQGLVCEKDGWLVLIEKKKDTADSAAN